MSKLRIFLFVLFLVPTVIAQDQMLGIWEGSWAVEEAEFNTPESAVPLDSLPASLPVRIEMSHETEDLEGETTGWVFVDSELFGAAWPLRISDGNTASGLIRLTQGPRGSLGNVGGILLEPDRFEGMFSASVCIVPGACDIRYDELPSYYWRLGTLELSQQLSLEPEDLATCHASSTIIGDINGDGSVGFPDFLVLSANFGQQMAGHADGDLNCDGAVTFADFLSLSESYGNSVDIAGVQVPEPCAAVLLVSLLLVAGTFRRSVNRHFRDVV